MHINKTHTTPYHPQSDGLIERLNHTIQTTVLDGKGEWEECLPKFCLTYNTSKHSATGFILFLVTRQTWPLVIMYYNHKGLCPSYYGAEKDTGASIPISTGTAAARQKKFMTTKSMEQLDSWCGYVIQ